MQVLCSKCGQVLAGNDLNVVTDIARCPRCNEVFALSSLVHASSSGPVNLDDPPRGAWYQADFNGFVVGATTRHPMAFFLVPFMCVWSGGESHDYDSVRKAMSAIELIDPRGFHALRRIYFREVTKDELGQGKETGLLRLGIEIEKKIEFASGRLEALIGFAEGVVAFKNAEAYVPVKAPDAKPVTR